MYKEITHEVMTDCKFLSDAISQIPSNCLFNKGVTGCGGTHLEIISERDSIILVPNINLVLSKTKQHSNLIGVYGDVTEESFKFQFNKQKIKKIIATYDALDKLIRWIGEDIYNYFLLVDEYHILFNSYDFRYKAISFILDHFKEFKNHCFMTATPLKEYNILEELKDLDRVTLVWPQSIPVKTELRNVFFTSKEVTKEINKALESDYNLHIFINSINTIRSIVKTIGTKDFRTICSKIAETADTRIGGKLQVKSINSNVCKINFYTATAFEGVDIYDPIGKTIIVSDTNVAQSLVDISTLFIQICGRLRDSKYKDEVLFICNTNNHRYLQFRDQETFDKYSDELTDNAINYGIEFLKANEGKQKIDMESYDNDPDFYRNRYIGKRTMIMNYDPNLKKIDHQNYEVLTKVFNKTVNIINNLNDTGKVEVHSKINKRALELYNVLPAMLLTSKQVEDLFEELDVEDWNVFAAMFKKYYDKKLMTIDSKRQNVYDFTKLKFYIES